MTARRGTKIAAAALLVGVTGAIAFASLRPRTAPAPDPLGGVEVAGCAARTQAACEITEPARLKIWLPEATRPNVRSDSGEPKLSNERAIGGGTAFEVEPPPGARELVFESGGRRFVLPLSRVEEPPLLARARALRGEGKLDEARRELEAGLPGATPELAARIRGALARVLLATGETDAAVRTFRESMAAAERAGRISDAALDAVACAFALSRESRLPEADEVLARAAAWASADPEALARLPYYRAHVAISRGDHRRALVDMRDARARAERLGMEALARNATEAIAVTLTELGRFAEAIELQRSLLDGIDEEPGCEKSDVSVNLAWMLLRIGAPDAARHSDAALRSLTESRCADPYREKNALLTAALAALRAGDRKLASSRLERARNVDHGGVELGLWQLDLEAELALGAGDLEKSAALYAREADLAGRAGAGDARWRALTGHARVLARQKRASAAVALLFEAEKILDELLSVVPQGEGRDTFLTSRDESARLLVRLLIDDGEHERAFAVARRARARVLRSTVLADRLAGLSSEERRRWDAAIRRYRTARRALEQDAERQWELPSDRLEASKQQRATKLREVEAALDEARSVLPSSGAGELPPGPDTEHTAIVAYFSTSSGWVSFTRTKAALEVAELGEKPDPLRPIRALPPGVREIVVLPYGSLRQLDFHAQLLDGKPLIERYAVVYGMDLPHAPGRDAQSALIVGDPLGDLPRARKEATLVAGAIGSRARVVSGAQATRTAVLDALSEVGLLHYAGHGSYQGRSGSASALLLANGQELSLSDVLALPKVPHTVVLSACEAARSDATSAPETLGLAHAFIARGAGIVIAATRPVDDRLASALMERMYRSREESLADALRAAQIELARSTKADDWAAFRVMTP